MIVSAGGVHQTKGQGPRAVRRFCGGDGDQDKGLEAEEVDGERQSRWTVGALPA